MFTYGPLGFLDVPNVVNDTTAVLSALYELGMRIALAVSFLWVARRNVGPLWAILVAGMATAITPGSVIPLSLACVWCLVALGSSAPTWARNLVVLGGPPFAALQALVKLNVGIAVLALVAIAIVGAGGRRTRNIALGGASFVAAFAVLWLASGQGLGNLDDFVTGAREVIAGYSEAMQTKNPYVPWDRAAALLVVVATIGATYLASRDLPRARQMAALAVVALLTFALAKQGFVRHSASHVELFIGGMVAPWVALRPPFSIRLATPVIVAAIALLSWPLSARDPVSTLQPRLAYEQLRALLDPARREGTREFAQARRREAYAVDPAILERIGNATVHVLPWELTLIWAYDLNWRPLPVPQDYTAYTPKLDRLNADALASPEGPEFLLRHLDLNDNGSPNIDFRYQPFDTPAAARAMLCNYREALTRGPYQLLERAPNRCGEPRPVSTVTADLDEPVEVPRVGRREVLFAQVEGAVPNGIEKLRTFVYRAGIRSVTLDDQTYRLIGANAADGLIISAPRAIDFSEPFALAPNPASISFGSDGGFATSRDPVEISFYAVPVEPRVTGGRRSAREGASAA